jgi:thiopurine S-methyltransferase
MILEQTFFCAIPPNNREMYARKMHELLKPKGILTGLLFNFPLTDDGPPFGGSIEEYLDLFDPYFLVNFMETAQNSIKPREDKELFFIFENRI